MRLLGYALLALLSKPVVMTDRQQPGTSFKQLKAAAVNDWLPRQAVEGSSSQ